MEQKPNEIGEHDLDDDGQIWCRLGFVYSDVKATSLHTWVYRASNLCSQGNVMSRRGGFGKKSLFVQCK